MVRMDNLKLVCNRFSLDGQTSNVISSWSPIYILLHTYTWHKIFSFQLLQYNNHYVIMVTILAVPLNSLLHCLQRGRPWFFTNPMSANSLWQLTHLKHLGCQHCPVALITRPITKSPTTLVTWESHKSHMTYHNHYNKERIRSWNHAHNIVFPHAVQIANNTIILYYGIITSKNIPSGKGSKHWTQLTGYNRHSLRGNHAQQLTQNIPRAIQNHQRSPCHQTDRNLLDTSYKHLRNPW